MRIIAGRFGGLKIDAPKGHKTHPMSEKMRGALFNVLGDVDDLTVLDAFGGSGAVALEAVSRGAKSAIVIEIDKSALNVIEKNIKTLKIGGQITAVRANSASWSENNYTTLFDLVICDPPYDAIKNTQLKQLTINVRKDGLLVLSLPSDYPRPKYDGFELTRDRDYGDGSLVFYRRMHDE